MTDFLLELLSEEIPARMQDKAQADLARLFSEQLAAAGLAAEAVETYATPRRLALIARGLPAETQAVREETKGPRASAPPQALEGFLRKTGLTREQLVERDGVYFAVVDRPGRATSSVLAEAIPAIVRAFPWPKSMRWGAASVSTGSPRWVRPLQGIVALLGEEIAEFEIAGISSGAATVGHRFHHPGIITIGSANDYAEKLRACRVIVDPEERRRIVRDGAAALAAGAGLALIEDEGLVAENAGLTEWPVPLLGSFDPAFLEVPAEVIQLTMRTNQKYFALLKSSPAFAGEGDPAQQGGGASSLADAFICTANIEASDGGAAIVAGNERVLSARLSDAKFFWEQDLKVPLKEQARKLGQIVFHEKLGTVADKVDRVARLARWLVEEGIVSGSSPGRGGGPPAKPVVGGSQGGSGSNSGPLHQPAAGPPPRAGEETDLAALADLAEGAARLCKADLVTQMVGEFPELQGVIGGHLARAQGEHPAVADAIRDHYKPVGQGDEVPTAPVTVAVSLADKLDTICAFFANDDRPTGSKDPYALRRAALGIVALLDGNQLRLPLSRPYMATFLPARISVRLDNSEVPNARRAIEQDYFNAISVFADLQGKAARDVAEFMEDRSRGIVDADEVRRFGELRAEAIRTEYRASEEEFIAFFADRLKVQQREAGVRHDLIDAVFALGGEDDLVRLLARVKALQAFVETSEGADLLAGYKRAANILKKEGWKAPSPQGGEGWGEGALSPSAAVDAEPPRPALSPEGEGQNRNEPLSYTPEKEEARLIAALDSAEPLAAAAVAAEDFEGAMAALASLRAPIDAFFDKVTVNDPDPDKREARLALLARFRAAVQAVADFSRIEG